MLDITFKIIIIKLKFYGAWQSMIECAIICTFGVPKVDFARANWKTKYQILN